MSDYDVNIILEMKAKGLEQAALVAGAIKAMGANLDELRNRATASGGGLDEMRKRAEGLGTSLESARGVVQRFGESHRTLEGDLGRVGKAIQNAGGDASAWAVKMRDAERDTGFFDRAVASLSIGIASRLGGALDLAGSKLQSFIPSLSTTAKEVDKVAVAVDNAGKAATRATGSGSGGGGFIPFLNAILPGGTTAVYVTLAITALAAAFGPLTAELAASVVLMAAWVVGATAFLGVVALAAGGLLLLGGAIGFLGVQAAGGLDPVANLDKANKALAASINATEAAQEAVRLAQLRYDARPTAVNLQVLKDAQEQLKETQLKQVQAQNAVNVATQQAAGPIAVLHEKIVALGQSLGQQALPMTNQFAAALLALEPVIEPVAHQMVTWLGDRMPLIIDQVTTAFFGLMGVLDRIGKAWGAVIDEVLGHPFEYDKIFGTFVDMAVRAIEGLLKNLVALSNWFIERFPVLQGNANSFFGNLGTVVQAVATVLGHFVDWVIAAWPSINHAFQETWTVIKEGWAQVSPMFSLFGTTLEFLKPTLKDIADHLYLFKPLLELVAAAFLIIIGVVYLVMVILIALAALLTVVAFVLTKLVEYIISQIPVAGAQFSAFGKVVHDQLQEAGAQMSALGTTVHAAVDIVKAQLKEAGDQMSGLGTTADAASKAVGTAWDAIGKKVAEIQQKNSVVIATGNDEQSKKIRDANSLNQSVVGMAWNAIYTSIAFWLNEQWKEVARQWNAITSFLGNAWNALLKGASYWWNAIYNAVAFWLNSQWQEVVRQWNAILGFLNGAWNAINSLAQSWWGTIRNTIVNWANNIQSTVQGIWNGMVSQGGSAMDRLGGAVRGGLDAVFRLFNIFIDAVNKALSPIIGHSVVANLPSRLAKGGVIPGYAPGQDTVPALLSPGEGVLTPQAVRGMGGAGAVNAINAAYQHFATGGVVGAPAGNPYPAGQCTWGVYSMFPGMPVDGNAKDWINLALQHASGPAAGEIVVYGNAYGPYGHVARVDGGLNAQGLFPVTEMNYKGVGIWDNRMSSMAGVLGFLNPGVAGAAGPSGASLIGGVDVVSPLVDTALSAARALLGDVPAWIRDLPAHVLDELANAIKSTFATTFTGSAAGASAALGTIGGNLGSWIAAAISATGVPGWWAPLLAVLVGRESGGNPNAINRTDSNALAGHPSQGLAQVIPGTFAAYHQPGTSGNILDPVANLAAAINYIKARYGSILNVQQANAALPPRGYDSGGNLPTGLSYVWNGTGRAETVTTAGGLDRLESVLMAMLNELRTLNGRQRSGALTAVAQIG